MMPAMKSPFAIIVKYSTEEKALPLVIQTNFDTLETKHWWKLNLEMVTGSTLRLTMNWSLSLKLLIIGLTFIEQ